jgi:hypothetical protein
MLTPPIRRCQEPHLIAAWQTHGAKSGKVPTVSSAGTEADAVVPTSIAAVVVVVIPKRDARADRREGVELKLELKVCPEFEFEWVSTGRIFPVRRDGDIGGVDCTERAPTHRTRLQLLLLLHIVNHSMVRSSRRRWRKRSRSPNGGLLWLSCKRQREMRVQLASLAIQLPVSVEGVKH